MLFRTFATLAGCTLLAASANAANLNFMGRSISSELTSEEVASFNQTVSSALNESPDRVTVHWQSPSSSTKGRVKIKYSYQYNDAVCRKAIFDLRGADGRRDFFHFNVCQRDGAWQLQKTLASNFSKAQWQALHEQFDQAINSQADGAASAHTEQGVTSTITPLSTATTERGKCRVMAIELSNSNDSAKGVYEFCQIDGHWQRTAP